MKQISFYGASGAEYVFQQAEIGAAPIGRDAVVVFTAADSYGLRVIRVGDVDRMGLSVLQAYLEAQHYGANTMFVGTCDLVASAAAVVADLEAGLSPVMLSHSPIFAAAA